MNSSVRNRRTWQGIFKIYTYFVTLGSVQTVTWGREPQASGQMKPSSSFYLAPRPLPRPPPSLALLFTHLGCLSMAGMSPWTLVNAPCLSGMGDRELYVQKLAYIQRYDNFHSSTHFPSGPAVHCHVAPGWLHRRECVPQAKQHSPPPRL